MKILFSSLTEHGHTYPLIPLATAAREAGHQVSYAVGPQHHTMLTGLGIDTYDAGLGIFQALTSLAPPDTDPFTLPEDELMRLIHQVFGEILPRAFATDLEPIIESVRPDLIIHELGNPGAGLAAVRAGIPGLCHGFGRPVADKFTDNLRDMLSKVAADIGVDLPEQIVTMDRPFLDLCPEPLHGPGALEGIRRVPIRPVPFCEPGFLPPVARPDRPRPLVYLTLGTAFAQVPLLKKAIAGLSALDVDVVVAAGPRIAAEDLGADADNVTVLAWAPQADLLPFVDLAVHHGGSGTTFGALGAAVPQLVLPQGADQFNNAEMVVSCGAGESIQDGERPADATEEAIAEAAKRLLTAEGVREGTDRAAALIAAMPSPAEVAVTLPNFV